MICGPTGKAINALTNRDGGGMLLETTRMIWVLYVTMVATSQLAAVASGSIQDSIQYGIIEGVPGNTVIGNIIQDTGLNKKYPRSLLETFEFGVLQGDSQALFVVDKHHGLLRLNRTLDRDILCPRQPACSLALDVAIVKPVEYFQIIKIHIIVIDENDNSPRFPQHELALKVSESATPGVRFVLPEAVDPDSAEFGIQSYQLILDHESDRLEPAADALFALDTTRHADGTWDVKLVLTARLDREVEAEHRLEVVARDGGTPPRAGVLLVSVEVVDANDNPPRFGQDVYEVTVRESSHAGATVVQVYAEDLDHGRNGHVQYKLTPPSESTLGHLFGITQDSGEVYLKEQLDYEKEVVHSLLITATDRGPSAVPAYAKVIVHVQDVNDFTPRIFINTLSAGVGVVELQENNNVGDFVAHISVEDLDHGASGEVMCFLAADLSLPDDTPEPFHLQKIYDHEFKVLSSLVFDRESEDQFSVRVMCNDLGNPPLSSTATISVQIMDVNDNPPVFHSPSYTRTLTENNSPPTPLLTVNAADPDLHDNGLIRYRLDDSIKDRFAINEQTGLLSTVVSLDHERVAYVDFVVYAVDGGTPAQTGTVTVQIFIQDANDERPIFTQQFYSYGTFENQPIGTEIGVVLAQDKDAAPFNKFTYSIHSPGDRDSLAFDIHPTVGTIVTTKVLDREYQAAYYLVVKAIDVVNTTLSSTASVTVYVADKNDNAPTILFPNSQNNSVYISDLAPLGHVISEVIAQDPDLGNNHRLTYSIAKGNNDRYFSMDPSNGFLILNRQLRPRISKKPTFRLTVLVRDHGSPEKSAVSTIFIHVNYTTHFINDLETLNDVPTIHVQSPVASMSETAMNTTLSGGGLLFHQKIIVGLSCATTVLAGILIIIIIWMRKRQTREAKRYKYACPLATSSDTGDPDLDKISVSRVMHHETTYVRVEQPDREADIWIPRVKTPSPPPPPADHDLSASSSGISTGSEDNVLERQPRTGTSNCSPPDGAVCDRDNSRSPLLPPAIHRARPPPYAGCGAGRPQQPRALKHNPRSPQGQINEEEEEEPQETSHLLSPQHPDQSTCTCGHPTPTTQSPYTVSRCSHRPPAAPHLDPAPVDPLTQRPNGTLPKYDPTRPPKRHVPVPPRTYSLPGYKNNHGNRTGDITNDGVANSDGYHDGNHDNTQVSYTHQDKQCEERDSVGATDDGNSITIYTL